MKYVGSKARIGADIYEVMRPSIAQHNVYIEPFCGGCNMMQHVVANQRIACDGNKYIVEMWKALQQGWVPPTYTRECYKEVMSARKNYPPHVVGWLGVACSYGGRWFGGYAGKVTTATRIVRDYQAEALRNVLAQLPALAGVDFVHCDYRDAVVHKDSVVYCDPPYAGTTGYGDRFNSVEFWRWARTQSELGQIMFVSEYTAPDDFVCIWEKRVSSSLKANGVIRGAKQSIEKLFVHKSAAYIAQYWI